MYGAETKIITLAKMFDVNNTNLVRSKGNLHFYNDKKRICYISKYNFDYVIDSFFIGSDYILFCFCDIAFFINDGSVGDLLHEIKISGSVRRFGEQIRIGVLGHCW